MSNGETDREPRDFDKVGLPPKPGKPGGLGEKIELQIERVLVWFYNNIIDEVSARIREGFDNLLAAPRAQLRRAATPLLNKIKSVDDLPPEVRSTLDEMTSTEPITLTLVLSTLVMGVIGGLISGVVSPIQRLVAQFIDAGLETARADPSAAWPMTWRSPQHADELMRHMKQTGWNETVIDAWREVVRPRPSPAEFLVAIWRSDGSENSFRDELVRQGYTSDDIDRLLTAFRFIPGPADLVRMAVREAFKMDTVRRYGYDQDWPDDFGTWMRRQGDQDGWAERYWYAHWELPSVQMAMEMLHRTVDDNLTTVIDSATFSDLLKLADIAPYWRDKIEAISYATPTRVDVRRAYKEGSITLQQVKRTYADLGYVPAWQDILTEWTAIAYEPEEQEATKGEVLAAFRRGTLTESEAREALANLQYGAEMVDFYVAQEQYKRAQEAKNLRMDAVQKEYETGSIDKTTAITRLTALALPASEIDASVELWTITRGAKTKRPTKAESEQFYKNDLVTSDEYRQMLDDLGIGDQYINLYVRQADAEKSDAAAKEAERAQKEIERVAKAERVSVYQRLVAEIDVQIAEQRLAITTAQTALNATMSAEEILSARTEIAQLDAEIAAEREAAAREKEGRQETEAVLDARISAVLRSELEARISDAQTEIARLESEIAAADVEIERAQLAMIGEEDLGTTTSLKTYVQEQEVVKAELKLAVSEQDIAVTEARAELRAYITDEERQQLERAIREAETRMAQIDVRIREHQERQAVLRAQITTALNDEQRAALRSTIDTARRRIAEFQVQRAEAKIEEVA